MSNLASKKCEPCSGNTPKLSLDEIHKQLSKINLWSLNDNKEMIFKKFKFKNFKETNNFVNKISNIAAEKISTIK